MSDNSDYDSDFEVDNKDAEMEKMSEKLKACMARVQKQRDYKPNMLTSAQINFVYLEHHSLVDYVEMDDEYIVSTGRDHDINVWDADTGSHIRRLSGHRGPVTGLHINVASELINGKCAVTSSEDGTIRQWLLKTGEEIRRFETDAVITCMGVLNDALAVTGNNKGYMQVHHLLTGDLYSIIMAHFDPIDTIVVRDNFACTATYDPPSSFKVWEIHMEQITCIYRIDDAPTIQFMTLALWKTSVFLGDSTEPKIHCINFKTDEKGVIDLNRSAGNVRSVRVVNGWILSCSAHKKDIVLDVHRSDNYDHFGTFSCKMKQVYAVAAKESDRSLKIVVGGSALAVLKFEFILELTRYNRRTEKSKFTEKTVEPNYELLITKNDECPAEGLSDSSDDSIENTTIISKPIANDLGIAQTRTSSGDVFTLKPNDTDGNAEREKGSKILHDKIDGNPNENKVFQLPPLKNIPVYDEMRKEFNVYSQIQPRQFKTKANGFIKPPEESVKMQCEKICQTYKDEPRVALKKLDELLLDRAATDSVKCTNTKYEMHETVERHEDTNKQRVDIYGNMFKNFDGKMSQEIIEEDDKSMSVRQTELNFLKSMKESEQSVFVYDNGVEHTDWANTDEGRRQQKGKFKNKKRERSKSDTKKSKNKNKCLKCQIM